MFQITTDGPVDTTRWSRVFVSTAQAIEMCVKRGIGGFVDGVGTLLFDVGKVGNNETDCKCGLGVGNHLKITLLQLPQSKETATA